MNAPKQVDKLIREIGDWRGEVIGRLRNVILSADPQIAEEWKWMGTPTYSKNSVICIKNPHKGKVKITFANGAALADTHKLFNNGFAGKKWRAIDILEGVTINERNFKALVKEAAAYDDALKSKSAARKTKAKTKLKTKSKART
jgi:hypothetical protein